MNTHSQNKRLLELGGIQAMGNVLCAMRDMRCPLTYQDVIHEAIDRAYIRLGDHKREPRSTAVRMERGMCICPDHEDVSPADGCPTHDPIRVVKMVPVDEEADNW